MSQAAPSHSSRDLSLQNVWSLVTRSKKFILELSLLFGAVASLWGLVTPNIYESRATIMPKSGGSQNPLALIANQLSSMPGLGGILGASGGNSEIKQFQIYLQSDSISEKALEVGYLESQLLTSLRLSTADSKSRGKMSEYLKKNLSIRIDGPALYLRFRSKNKELAEHSLEAYLSALQNFLNGKIVTQSRGTELFVKARLADLSKQVDEAEQHLSALRTGQINPSDPQKSLQSEIMRAERDFIRLNKLSELLSQQYELARIEAKQDDPMFIVIDAPAVAENPVGPKRLFTTILSTLLGAFFAIVYLYLKQRFHWHIQSIRRV